jgi:LuxR family maltose regulon positive regulatory protein
VVEARLVRALAHRADGDGEAAVAELGTALAGGVPAGYCRLFLDEGPPMMELLARVPAPGARPHAERLLAAARKPPVSAPASDEGLSERELEVLRLLATTMRGPDIARELYMSVNTFRTHTRHIFTKLDVNTRADAVRRAGELGVV